MAIAILMKKVLRRDKSFVESQNLPMDGKRE